MNPLLLALVPAVIVIIHLTKKMNDIEAVKETRTENSKIIYEDNMMSDETVYNYDRPMLATGGGESHNNMPPYIVAYCWRRTA